MKNIANRSDPFIWGELTYSGGIIVPFKYLMRVTWFWGGSILYGKQLHITALCFAPYD